jgi:hypothetical protein
MLNDFRKSIQSVLYERIRSPFSGAFFFSWIVWNWKLVYYLIFSAGSTATRIEYVQANYINLFNNLIFPFLSTIFLIVVYPFITTAGYWVWLKFKTWQIKIRNGIEGNRLLTLDQSITLRMQIRNQEEEFDKMLRKKDEEILILKNQIEESTKSKNQEIMDAINPVKSISTEDFHKFTQTEFYKYFDVLIYSIMSRNALSEDVVSPTVTAYYESNGIIKRDKGLLYLFTEKGLEFVKHYLEDVKAQ